MNCAGCRRQLEVGDRYIQATASEYLGVEQGREATPELDGIMAEVLGSGHGDKVVYCEDCTVPGGHFRFDTVYGDEDA